MQNNPIKGYGVVKIGYHCETTEGNEVKCETDFQVAEVNENVMSAGEVIRRNAFRAVLDDDRSYFELETNPKVRVPLYLRRSSFYIRARVGGGEAGQPLLVAPVPLAAEHPLDQPMGDAEKEHVEEIVELGLIEEVRGDDIANQEIGREWWPAGLHPDSGVENMRHWLRSHYHPVYGTKLMLWQRVPEKNKRKLEQEAVQTELARQLEERRQGAPNMPAVPARVPQAPTDVGREEHELTHAKCASTASWATGLGSVARAGTRGTLIVRVQSASSTSRT